MSLKANLNIFIKNTIVELACNNRIDHRNYEKNIHDSKLKTGMVKNNYNFDLTINEILEELLQDETFLDMVQSFQKGKVKNEEEEYELCDVYYTFIKFIGLNELQSLHGDSSDNFQSEFLKAIIL
jgi:hypothetical protein